MRIAAVQLPARFAPGDPSWDRLHSRLRTETIDLLILNELPLGEWSVDTEDYDPTIARDLHQTYETLLGRLAELPVGAVLTTRAILGRHRLVNQAVFITGTGVVPLHCKHIFPQEPGFFEQSWFEMPRPQFKTSDFHGLHIGVLICTELMFSELARGYGHAGAHLIAVPRASENIENWVVAARMAALASGCYVASSNRHGVGANGLRFGGGGFIVAPGGEVLAMTSEDSPVVVAEIDLELVRTRQSDYPCYLDPDFLRLSRRGGSQ
ncbi:carbon-nitrogen hydrolase family protein [Rhizobium sp. NPDC090279]|uniref:carbon-nitrogen hydrolase family protein n=1 Tax=Rhizobium sp. NPDC090279 TaxID=3364499 RepID=UPI003839E19E